MQTHRATYSLIGRDLPGSYNSHPAMFSELLPNLKQFFWFFSWDEVHKGSTSIALSQQGASLVARVQLQDPAAVLLFSCPMPVQLDKSTISIRQLNAGVEIRASVASVFPSAPVEPRASVMDAKRVFCKSCQAALNSSSSAYANWFNVLPECVPV